MRSRPGGLTPRAKYFHELSCLTGIPAAEREALKAVTGRYAFRANDYYLQLIKWDDLDDPIRRLVIPRMEELQDWGGLDPSHEADNTVAPGLQHKYADTVVLICNETCGANCRYCFRKRLFMKGNAEVTRDFAPALSYIAVHPEVSEVLLTGGDPLLLGTSRLADLLRSLHGIPHVRVIRVGSKLPAFNPQRILEDDELLACLRDESQPSRRIYLMTHFDHPRELTDTAVAAVDALIDNGVICANQCPLIHGVNDDPEVLAELYRRLGWIGCPPYYLFQCRPTAGNRPYQVPIVTGWKIFQEVLRRGSGLARRARFVMSHASGKIEILSVDARHIYLRYHRAKEPGDGGSLMVCRRDDRACWLDDLEVVAWQPLSPHTAGPGGSAGAGREQMTGTTGAEGHRGAYECARVYAYESASE